MNANKKQPFYHSIEVDKILNSHSPFISKVVITIIPLFIKCTSPTFESKSINNHENKSLVKFPEIHYRKIKPEPHLNSNIQFIFDHGEYAIIEDSDLRLLIIKIVNKKDS